MDLAWRDLPRQNVEEVATMNLHIGRAETALDSAFQLYAKQLLS
jgi:hypothetical protein